MRTSKRNAFTLIELLVVIVIIGLLSSLVAPQFFGKLENAKTKTAQAQLSMLATALDSFYLDTNRYPNANEGLAILSSRKADIRGFNGPYLSKPVKEDPWGNPYAYKIPGPDGNPYGLSSLGADGAVGGSDEAADISVWE